MAREEFNKPEPRKDIIAKLANDAVWLKAKGESFNILLCFSCDPYQPINDKVQITKKAIEILHFYGQTVTILTKGGYRAIPDMSLLSKGDQFAVTLTCTVVADSLRWEPGAALPQERIDTLKEAKARGLYTWVSLEPVLYPEQSLDLIRLTHDFVDKYKLGVLNYVKPDKPIKWKEYGEKAIELVKSYGNDFYVKEDLKKYLAVAK
jgi:DNA repair photolyase